LLSRKFEEMRLLSLFTFIFFISSLYAQKEIDLSWSENLDFNKSNEHNKIVGIQKDNLYVVSSSNSIPQNSINVSLDIYDKSSLSLIKSVEICDNKSDFNYEKLIITENYIHLFTSFFDRQLGFKILSIQTFQEEDQSFGESTRIDEVFTDEKNDKNFFKLATSPDGKYILIYHNNTSRSGNKFFNMKVINEDFTTMWEKEIELNYKERMVEIQDLIIDDNSTVHLLSSINPYGIGRSSGFGALLNIKNALFTYRPYEDKLKEIEFALTRNWINTVSMVLDENQHLLATAFYTYPNDYKMRGFVMIRLQHETGAIMTRKMITFSKEQYNNVELAISRLKEHSRNIVGTSSIYPGTSSHMNNTSTEFSVKKVLVHDGNIIYAIEALRKDERCTESFNEQQMIVNCEKHYLYGDILLFFVTSNGVLKSINNIEKMQHSIDKGNPYYSFSITSNQNDLLLMYNDESSNTLIKSDQKDLKKKPLSNMKKASLEMVLFNIQGGIQPMKFTRSESDNIRFLPHEYKWINNSELLLYSQKEKSYKFGKLMLH